ncbi:MAG: NAD(P)H-dependent oxidoreductase subunit E [Candidatus Omnitrophica bacterium]|nr:NAD(P)H-dependent oxidoreductase subunit E [Candidatus Omnitrophota bacterium]
MNNLEKIKFKTDPIVARYETKRASILEILRLLQEEYGHITTEMEREVAEYLGIAAIDVREVMTFYSLFYDKPKARTRFHVCRTLSCYLRGGREILKHIENKLGVKAGGMTEDKAFSINTVECLGACEFAPMMQVNDVKYVGPLTKEKIDEVITKLQKGSDPF